MKVGLLLSGGKDSLFAGYVASFDNDICCAITIRSKNKESYMFHTPNIDITSYQASSMGVEHIIVETEGEKEKELEQLRQSFIQAKQAYGIQGIVTGAVASQYQASRIQQLCDELDLWCFNPLWQIPQLELLELLEKHKFETMIVGVFAYPFEKNMLGTIITQQTISLLQSYQKKYQIHPAGEGGEIETLVLDCPLFSKRLRITDATVEYENYAGTYTINSVEFEESQSTSPVSISPEHPSSPEYRAKILIVDCTRQDIPLLRYEFIRPLTQVVSSYASFDVVPVSKVTSLDGYDGVIISGTALHDDQFLDHVSSSSWLNNNTTPVLGICAGMEFLASSHKASLIEHKEIGPFSVSTIDKFPFATSKRNPTEYFLHHTSVLENDAIHPLQRSSSNAISAIHINSTHQFGVQYHPEVNDQQLLRDFIQYCLK